jgi:hypothetical protein
LVNLENSWKYFLKPAGGISNEDYYSVQQIPPHKSWALDFVFRVMLKTAGVFRNAQSGKKKKTHTHKTSELINTEKKHNDILDYTAKIKRKG